MDRLPDECTILGSYRLLEGNKLSNRQLSTIDATLDSRGLMVETGAVVHVILIEASSPSKSTADDHIPVLHQSKKVKQCYFGVEGHIGADADCGLIHTAIDTPATVIDITQGHALLHREGWDALAEAICHGAAKRSAATGEEGHTAVFPGERLTLDRKPPWGSLLGKAEQLKASVRVKVKHAFRLTMCQFGFNKLGSKGLAKNTARLPMLFAMSICWMERRRILVAQEQVRSHHAQIPT